MKALCLYGRLTQKQVKSKEVTPLYGKRKWDDSDLEDKHEVKRYKK